MANSVLLFLIFLSFSYASLGEDLAAKIKKGREPRKYDNLFEYATYQNSEDTEKSDIPLYTDAGSMNVKSQPDKTSHTNSQIFKGSDQSSPSYPSLYKGYPHWQDYPQFNSKGAFSEVSTDPTAQMMTMINYMKMIQDTKEDNQPGFLNKLISDPKSILVAAILPVSIMLASFIPLVVNYFMTGVSLPSVITSTANNKMGRSFNETQYLDKVLEGLSKYGEKIVESEGCIEETVCKIVIDSSDGKDGVYFQRVVNILANIVRSEWLGQSRVSVVLSGIKQRNCSNLCGKNMEKDI